MSFTSKLFYITGLILWGSRGKREGTDGETTVWEFQLIPGVYPHTSFFPFLFEHGLTSNDRSIDHPLLVSVNSSHLKTEKQWGNDVSLHLLWIIAASLDRCIFSRAIWIVTSYPNRCIPSRLLYLLDQIWSKTKCCCILSGQISTNSGVKAKLLHRMSVNI